MDHNRTWGPSNLENFYVQKLKVDLLESKGIGILKFKLTIHGTTKLFPYFDGILWFQANNKDREGKMLPFTQKQRCWLAGSSSLLFATAERELMQQTNSQQRKSGT
jgi:hypothetical protein